MNKEAQLYEETYSFCVRRFVGEMQKNQLMEI